MKHNPTTGPVRTSAAFRVLQAQILLLAIEGKELADIHKDKLWRCLCNAFIWATDGVVSKRFVFDLEPKKSLDANISKKPDYSERDRWLAKIEDVLDGAEKSIATSISPTAQAEQICFSLLETSLLIFRQGKYSEKISVLFQTAQNQLTNAPIPDAITCTELEKIPFNGKIVSQEHL